MRSGWLFFCALVCLFFASAGASYAQKPVVRRDLGFSCVLPKGYQDVRAQVVARTRHKEKPALAVVRTFAPKQYAAISLMVAPSGGRFLRDYLPLDKNIQSANPGSVVRDKTFLTVAGKQALRTTVQKTGGRGPTIRREVWVVTNGYRYNFVLIAPPSRFKASTPDLDNLLTSVRWFTPTRSVPQK